jgi:hypothetical protein
MPMNPRLLRPIASGVHPEANAWRTAVVANGGSVSASTMRAVSKFCADIDKAGLRDRFFRLNLLAGTGLNACLVPLYRGQSRTGTQFGNTTDTNVGPFVSGDYAETGASGGLTGDGIGKHLDTGFLMNTLPSSTSGHVSAYNNNRSANASGVVFRGIAGVNIGSAAGFGLAADNGLYSRWGNSIRIVDSTNGLLVATRTSDVLNAVYAAGTQLGTNTDALTPTASTLQAVVFCDRNLPNNTRFFDTGRYQAYSIGTGLTASDVTAFNTIMVAFQTALSRA